MTGAAKRQALTGGQFKEIDDKEVDFELGSPNKLFGPQVNLLPLQSAVAGPRLFYGSKFVSQSLPLVDGEAPLVQTAMDDDPDGRSFDDDMGRYAGAQFADDDAEVLDVTPDRIKLRLPDGSKVDRELYNNFPFNRMSAIHNTPLVQKGDQVKKGQILAKSNFTDDNGSLAMGTNVRVGVVPYLGHSMDDAMVISESMAKRLQSEHMYGYDIPREKGMEVKKNHFTSLFPKKFTVDQLKNIGDDGIVQEGATVSPGDPLVLATKPRMVSSKNAQLGRLGKYMKNTRTDASTTWDHHSEGVVRDVTHLRDGTIKFNITSANPSNVGDKITFRTGQKGVISHIIPDEHMPRTMDGKPLELLLNPQGIPSRVNNALPYEILLGKVARKTGKPFKLPGFTKKGEKWYDIVEKALADAGVEANERVFDPKLNRELKNPIMVGEAYVNKLVHVGDKKLSVRGQGGYSQNEQPLHGGGETAKAKRLSGLESHALLSAGAYGVLREGATVRGQKNDEFWRSLRNGLTPREPGRPFAWNKFLTLLSGAGYNARDMGDGRLRLQFMTDRDLDAHRPIEVAKGDIVDLKTMEPVQGGLFSAELTGANNWGAITLPERMPNPAAEEVIRKMLGLTAKQFRAILAGEEDMPPAVLKLLKDHAQADPAA